ncbi:hypothetical protein DVH24_008767 [Malus domestica]|uniref:Uncharacterized protein n=1 Tax=Malus domestica TaxID=3750 RepID=A0A498JQV5_MALDO|nr:hypothetical protein DVH24_008767 [Malus domestica]
MSRLQSFCGNAYYHEADMRTGKATYWQLTSLQAFWTINVASHRTSIILCALNWRNQLSTCIKQLNSSSFPLGPKSSGDSFFLSEMQELFFPYTIFTTEGHPPPVLSSWHERLPETYIHSNWTCLKVLLLLYCISSSF